MKKLSILALLLFSAISMQAVSIKGFVIDKKTNEPIIGAIVTVEGQNIGAQTDFDGRFVIKDVESGTDKLLVKSIGYKDHTRTITISDKNDIDLGKIYIGQNNSKNNRITLSYNPSEVPYRTLSDNGELEYGIQKGVAISYLHWFNINDNFTLELGGKYNYTWSKDEYGQGYHSEGNHHNISIFTNIAYNISFDKFTVSPYAGIFAKNYLYSKVSKGNSSGCEIYDLRDKSLFFGCHAGLGFKFNNIYLGAEISYDVPNSRLYDIQSRRSDEISTFNYSISIGYEF